MKWVQRIEGRMQSLTTAVSRFPFTALFLMIAVIAGIMNIQTESVDFYEWMLAGYVGALAAAVAQMVYERFFRGNGKYRLLLHIPAVLLAVLFYFVTEMDTDLFTQRVYLRTIALSFALFIAFIWVPAIRQQRLAFSDSFTATFKALVTTLLFSFVLMIGISAILSAISVLFTTVDYRLYLHTANIIGSLFAPLFFLSAIPVYPLPNETEPAQEVKLAVSVPRIMNVLLTYIIIPIVMIFTVILVLYILMNIGQDFWVNNLLEPMLVSYSITVILVMLLIGRLDNKIAEWFRLVFPKILFVIVLLQTIASIIQISEKGLTVGRYYVILFGIFAIIASIIFSIWPKQKNGLVAVVLIIFSVLSIIPPVDAFTVSKNGQITFLRTVLEENQMLEGNQIVPRSDLPAEEQQKIAETMIDLEELDAIDEISFLPESYSESTTFEETFGFDRFGGPAQEFYYVFFDWTSETVLDISDYDTMVKVQLDTMQPSGTTETVQQVDIAGEPHQLAIEETDNSFTLTLLDQQEQVVIRRDLMDVFTELNAAPQMGEQTLSLEQAFFTEENEDAVMDIIVLQFNRGETIDSVYFEGFVFIDVK